MRRKPKWSQNEIYVCITWCDLYMSYARSFCRSGVCIDMSNVGVDSGCGNIATTLPIDQTINDIVHDTHRVISAQIYMPDSWTPATRTEQDGQFFLVMNRDERTSSTLPLPVRLYSLQQQQKTARPVVRSNELCAPARHTGTPAHIIQTTMKIHRCRSRNMSRR